MIVLSRPMLQYMYTIQVNDSIYIHTLRKVWLIKQGEDPGG